jgi:hypothetical protein
MERDNTIALIAEGKGIRFHALIKVFVSTGDRRAPVKSVTEAVFVSTKDIRPRVKNVVEAVYAIMGR